MKHRARVLLSTISAAVIAAIFGSPTSVGARPTDAGQSPIERLSSIRKAYLSTLANEQSKAQFAERRRSSRAIPKLSELPQFLELAKSMTAIAPADCAGRTRLLILQSTPFCNIDCEYCYLPARRRSPPHVFRHRRIRGAVCF